MLSAGEQATLARCAAVREFDSKLFTRHLRSGPRVSLAALVRDGWVEESAWPGGRKRYWVASFLRRNAWELWWHESGGEPGSPPAPPVLRELAEQIAGYCRTEVTWPIERLRQLVIADPDAAREYFDQVFAEHYGRFDLAYCQDAIDALLDPERARFLPIWLGDYLRERRRQVTARLLRSTEFFQTQESRYQPRPGAEREFTRLISANGGSWLLQLHGNAGMGKSTLLHWFIAHACLAGTESFVPCARVNCDALDPTSVLDHPWLLLLEVAAQLNEQLPEGAYLQLLDSYAADRDRLRRMPAAGDSTAGDQRQADSKAEDVEKSFWVNMPQTSTPVVVVLDGLDQVSFRSREAPGSLQAIIQLLMRLHDKLPMLRVVLAGRDDLSGDELVPALREPAAGILNYPVEKFTTAETASYLTRRGIQGNDRASAIHKKTRGVPMQVALYADLLHREPGLTAAEIAQNDEPLVVFLIDRIINHIDDPVPRAVLKYSVAADPGLDFSFFSEVMLQSLRAMFKAADKALPLPQDDDEAGLRELWRRVVKHATNTDTWIRCEMRGDDDVVVIHDESRGPLRDMLRDDATFRQIHADAAAHYQDEADRALEDPQDHRHWPGEMRRVLYHLTQARDPLTLQRWRAARAKARELGHVDWVRDLAKSLADAQYSDGSPSLLGEFAPLRYEACVELALLAAQGAGRLPGDPQARPAIWHEDAERWLAAAGNAIPAGTRPLDYEIIIRSLLRVEQAASEVEVGQAIADLSEVTRASGATLGDACLVRARARRHQFGRAAYPSQPWAVEDDYQAAQARYTDQKSAAYVALDAARWLLSLDRPDLALRWCERIPDGEQGTLAAIEVRVRALLALGRPGSALVVAERGARGSSRVAVLQRLAARAQLTLRRPEMALRELEEATQPSAEGRDDQPPAADDPAGGEEEHLHRLAQAYSNLLEAEKAQDCLTLMQPHNPPESEQSYQARVSVAQALYHLRVTGDLRQAAIYAEKFPPKGRNPDDHAWTRLKLARAELMDRLGLREDTLEALTGAHAELTGGRTRSRTRVSVAITGLAARSLLPKQRAEFLELLADDLSAIAPAGRLAALAGLIRCREAVPDHQLKQRLRKLLGEAEPPRQREPNLDESIDQGWQDLVLAEAYRVIGDWDEFVSRRERALRSLAGGEPYVRWEWLIARAPEDTDHLLPPPSPAELAERYRHQHPLLYAAFLAAWAERYDKDHSRADVAAALRAAIPTATLPPTAQNVTIWEVRLREALAGYTTESKERERLLKQASEIRLRLDHSQAPKKEQLTRPVGPPLAGPAEVILSGGRRERDMLVHTPQRGKVQPLNLEDIEAGEDFPLLRWAWLAGQQLGAKLSSLLRESPEPIDIKLTFRRPGLALDPWELTIIDGRPLATHAKVRYVYRTAADALTDRHQRVYLRRVTRELLSPGQRPDGEPGGRALPGRAETEVWLKGLLKKSPDLPPGDQFATAFQTWAALRSKLRDNAESHGRRPLRVLIIHPIIGGNLDTLRGLSERLEELEKAYRHAFQAQPELLDLKVVYGDRVAELSAARPGRRHLADVLHVCTVMQATAQMPVLGLDADDEPPLTAPEVDQMVRGITGAIPPLVILDVQAPPAQAEVRRQLVLRNRFAQQLLALGSVNTIIAGGLAGQLAGEQWKLLATGLANGLNAAEICRDVQNSRPYDTAGAADPDVAAEAHAVAFTATGLFTNLPADTLIEPGLLRSA